MLFSSLYNLLGAKAYIGYDYVHIDNLTDISAYQNTMYSKYTVLIFTSNLALSFFAQRNVVWFNWRGMVLDKNNSIRYDNSAKFFVLAVTKLLSLTIKIAYADEKVPIGRHVKYNDVTYHIIGNHKCPLYLFC